MDMHEKLVVASQNNVGGPRLVIDRRQSATASGSNGSDCAPFVGPNFRVGKPIGRGNFGELRLGMLCIIFVFVYFCGDVYCISSG